MVRGHHRRWRRHRAGPDVPVFWVQNPAYVSACLATAVVMHFVAPLVESRYKVHLWFDVFGR